MKQTVFKCTSIANTALWSAIYICRTKHLKLSHWYHLKRKRCTILLFDQEKNLVFDELFQHLLYICACNPCVAFSMSIQKVCEKKYRKMFNLSHFKLFFSFQFIFNRIDARNEKAREKTTKLHLNSDKRSTQQYLLTICHLFEYY